MIIIIIDVVYTNCVTRCDRIRQRQKLALTAVVVMSSRVDNHPPDFLPAWFFAVHRNAVTEQLRSKTASPV